MNVAICFTTNASMLGFRNVKSIVTDAHVPSVAPPSFIIPSKRTRLKSGPNTRGLNECGIVFSLKALTFNPLHTDTRHTACMRTRRCVFHTKKNKFSS
jgi:hypothetical protein